MEIAGMELLRGFDSLDAFRGSFLSIGNFDGVHRGHQQMFACLVRHAREHNVPSCVFTFEPHPIQLLRPEHCPPALTSLEQKAELIEACGVDCMVVYSTDLRLLNLSAEDFFQSVVLGEFDAIGMVEGPNFFFGRNRSGTIKQLTDFCKAADIELDAVPPVFVGTQMVSSSVIRSLLLDGEVEEASDLLGHRYRVAGRVSKGSERGRTIGFPTANLSQVVTVLPLDGVYSGVAWHNGRNWPAAINLGPNPTFGERRRKLEVHLIGFEGDLYDQPLQVEFATRIRETMEFPDVEALKTQLEQDVQQALAVVTRNSNR
jgi:riboflavin kinase / FMN adenylyltransferase